MTAVCAHMNLGPHVHLYRKAASITGAVRAFRKELEKHYGTVDSSIGRIRGGTDMPCVDLYPACKTTDDLHCNSRENYHEFAMARFEVGPLGGIRRVTV